MNITGISVRAVAIVLLVCGVVLQISAVELSGEGTARVIVGLATARDPNRHVPGSEAERRNREDIRRAQDEVLASLPEAEVRNPASLKRFEYIPFMAMEVDARALQALEHNPRVVSIEADEAIPPALTQSTPLVKATNAAAAGWSGTGLTVAVLDTGVDKSHSFLSGKVVSEACYSTTSAGQSTSVCPGGVGSSTASGSGVPCTTSGCDHGTHVAGIAAGSGSSYSGVARGASLIAIQIFSHFDSAASCSPRTAPCVLTYYSDQILGLERVYALRTSYTIASVNMSIGGGKYTSAASCDSALSAYKTVVDDLRAVGIATVVASGNDGFKDGIGQPACISTAISVGSTIDAGSSVDTVSTFSNSASFLTMLAPGQVITSSVPGGGFSGFQGTSMATPHVAGAVAVLRQKCPSATVSQIITALTTTGPSITDSNGVTKRRLDVEAALAALCAAGSGCGTSSAVTVPATAVVTPRVEGLPAGGTWRREQRQDGESWFYTFTVAGPGPESGSTQPGGGDVLRHPADALAVKEEGGESKRTTDPNFGIPSLGSIRPRAASAEERQRFGSSSNTTPFLQRPDTAASGGSNALAETESRVVRLEDSVTIGPGVSALEVVLDDISSADTVSSARLYLKVKHNRAEDLDVWLAAADQEVPLWVGKSSGVGHAGTAVVIDRYLFELQGRPASDPMTILVADHSGAGTAAIDEAWLVLTLGKAATEISGPQATLDVYASRAYLRTASSGGGTEVSTPSSGQTVYFHVDYGVSGSGGSFYLNHRATIDGSLWCSFDAIATPGYSYYSWCSSGWTASAGSHTLRWDLDYYNSVAETSESNNAATKTFTPSGTPDVVALRSFLRTASAGGGSEVSVPTAGQSVYFHVDYMVNGSGPSFSLNHRATLDNSLWCSFDATASPGYSYYAWCGSAWTATAGSHTIRWDLDYYNTVSESSESNNSATKSFTTQSAMDVAATRAFLRTASGNGGSEVGTPAAGQVVYFHVDYSVAGSGSVTLSHRARINGTTSCSFDAAASGGFSYTGWCASGWTATVGSHTLQWDLDYNNTISESSESNNSASKAFTVAGFDVVADRAFMKTASSNGGSEVPVPTAGQSVYFHVDYHVTGTGTYSVGHRAVLDGSTFCSFDASATAGIAYIGWCTNAWAATSGAHTLRWDLDYAGTIAETNETNNAATLQFTTGGGGVDIVAQRAFLRTAASNGGSEVSAPALGQSVYFHGAFQVTGSGGAITVTERARLDGSTFCSCQTTATPGNSYVASCTQPWVATSGTHTLQWDFDHSNAVAETNESNNSTSQQFTTSSGGGGGLSFYAVPPCRIIDTRNAVGPFGGPVLPGATKRDVSTSGACGVPGGAKAVSLNLTVVGPAGEGWLVLFPGSTNRPLASTISYAPLKTRANNAVVKVGNDGVLSVYNGGQVSVHFLIDVSGYFQ